MVDSTAPRYVDVGLIARLENSSTELWDVRKLVAMLRELNAVHAAGHQYAALMLCRAIMDHVPPVFGKSRFADVVSQVSMSKTDKKYLSLLQENRFVSDDALHRHISDRQDIIELQDVPQRMGINTLVRLVDVHLPQDERGS